VPKLCLRLDKTDKTRHKQTQIYTKWKVVVLFRDRCDFVIVQEVAEIGLGESPHLHQYNSLQFNRLQGDGGIVPPSVDISNRISGNNPE